VAEFSALTAPLRSVPLAGPVPFVSKETTGPFFLPLPRPILLRGVDRVTRVVAGVVRFELTGEAGEEIEVATAVGVAVLRLILLRMADGSGNVDVVALLDAGAGVG
jgi:hypothetical protein